MDASLRRRRFRDRVTTERKLLADVNGTFGGRAPLAGLTEAAISSWEMRMEGLAQGGVIDTVAGLLREIAMREKLLSDNSKEVFDERPRRPDSSMELKQMLRQALERAQSAMTRQ